MEKRLSGMIMKVSKVQLIMIAVFVLINITVFYGSIVGLDESGALHPTFSNASDGQRYWGVGVNLARGEGFVIGEESVTPLARAGPLPAVVFSIPIRLFGFEHAAGWIVAIQCLFLYLMGLAFGRVGRVFCASEELICGLIIFNPNLISLAHHAQSDLLFTCVFGGLLAILISVLAKGEVQKSRQILWLGLLAGLLPLTRPLGFYVILVIPIFFVFSCRMSPVGWNMSLGKTVSGLIVIATIAAAIMMPWAYRNHITFGQVSLTQSEGVMMQWHYNALKKQVANPELMPNLQDHMKKYGVTEDCANDVRCRGGLTKAYFSAISTMSLSEVLNALAVSYSKLFLSGGLSQLGRYFGLEPVNFSNFLAGDRRLALEVKRIKTLLSTESRLFLCFVMGGIIFAGVARIFGLIGMVLSVVDRNSRASSLFFLLIIGVFLGMYLFSSIARFRAPLEPMLAVYAAVGIRFFLDKFRIRKVDTSA